MPDLSLLAIPAYWILAILPHTYSVILVSKHTQWNNANARGEGHMQHLKQKLPAAIYAKFERSEAAHKNSIENMPLFVAAIGAGLMAEKVARVDVGNAQYAAIWLAIRTLYNVLYINTENQKYSPLRSLTWLAGLGVSFYQIYKAAVALA